MTRKDDVFRLMAEGMRLSKEGKPAEAKRPLTRAWDLSTAAPEDEWLACGAAHYLAIAEPDVEIKHKWNIEALERSDAVEDRESVASFYPSIYLNLARSAQQLGRLEEAKRYCALARQHEPILEDNEYGRQIRSGLTLVESEIGQQ